jgi:hypothetical protein
MPCRPSPLPNTLAAAAIALALSVATPAAAQVETWIEQTSDTSIESAPVTSMASAIEPTAIEQRAARAFAAVVFASPAAAMRAGEKAEAAMQPDLAAVQPKPKWVADARLRVTGDGVQVKATF